MLRFSKYQGLGNDFLLLDRRLASGRSVGDAAASSNAEHLPDLAPEVIRRLCDRRFGVGADGIIVALPPRGDADLRMRIFNADGSEPEMCGNGIRCLARFLADRDGERAGRRWRVETLAGPIVPELLPDGLVRVDMGAPLLRPEAVPTTLPVGPDGLPQGEIEVEGQRFRAAAVGMGNPHLILPVDDLAAIDLERLGPRLEVDPAFPARTNVHFVAVLARDHVVMRVWERGAGPTLACGTGACATLVALRCLGLCDGRARVDLPGGSLEIAWDGGEAPVLMSGPAELVFEGALELCPASAAGGQAVATETAAAAATAASIDCATACVQGCQRPDDCPNAEARARVDALLGERSLDELVALASSSLDSRIRTRIERDAGTPL